MRNFVNGNDDILMIYQYEYVGKQNLVNLLIGH